MMSNNDNNIHMNIKNILWKYPVIYLIAFCFGISLFGLEIGEAYKHGLPDDNVVYYLKVTGMCAYLFFSLYFFYYFIKIKNMKAKKE